jgi:solute carrier family 12 sodium/potassium/chloride transporter 2
LPAEVQNSICRFRVKQKRGTIDVWWLYDDGGLSMLLPHILTTRSNWANSKLRVFCLADTNEEQRSKQERYYTAAFKKLLFFKISDMVF